MANTPRDTLLSSKGKKLFHAQFLDDHRFDAFGLVNGAQSIFHSYTQMENSFVIDAFFY